MDVELKFMGSCAKVYETNLTDLKSVLNLVSENKPPLALPARLMFEMNEISALT